MTGSIYWGDPGVDRHHLIIRSTHSIFPSYWSHALLPSICRSMQFVWIVTHSSQAFIDPRNLCGSSCLGIPSYPLTLFLSVSNGSKSPGRFRVRFRPGTELLQRVLPHENPDRCNWASFTTKNPAFQHHKFGSN